MTPDIGKPLGQRSLQNFPGSVPTVATNIETKSNNKSVSVMLSKHLWTGIESTPETSAYILLLLFL
jgi:hypothetical protein